MTVYLKVDLPDSQRYHTFVMEKNERKNKKPIELMLKHEDGEIGRRRSVKQYRRD